DASKPGSKSRPLAAVLIVVQDHALRRDQTPENTSRSVPRSVVHDDDLLRNRDGAHSFEKLPDGFDLVVDRDHDRKLHARKASTVRLRPSSKSTLGSYPRWTRASSIAARECRTSPGRGRSWAGRRCRPVIFSRMLQSSRSVAADPQATL